MFEPLRRNGFRAELETISRQVQTTELSSIDLRSARAVKLAIPSHRTSAEEEIFLISSVSLSYKGKKTRHNVYLPLIDIHIFANHFNKRFSINK